MLYAQEHNIGKFDPKCNALTIKTVAPHTTQITVNTEQKDD